LQKCRRTIFSEREKGESSGKGESLEREKRAKRLGKFALLEGIPQRNFFPLDVGTKGGRGDSPFQKGKIHLSGGGKIALPDQNFFALDVIRRGKIRPSRRGEIHLFGGGKSPLRKGDFLGGQIFPLRITSRAKKTFLFGRASFSPTGRANSPFRTTSRAKKGKKR